MSAFRAHSPGAEPEEQGLQGAKISCREPHRRVPGLVIAFLPKTGGKTGTGSQVTGGIRNLGSLGPTLLT